MKRNIIRVIIVLLIMIVVIVSCSILINSAARNAAKSADQTVGGAITVDGWIFCVPRKSPSDKCVIGVENSAGKYYALENILREPVDPSAYSSGAKVTIYGNLIIDSSLQNNYNIQGVIQTSQ